MRAILVPLDGSPLAESALPVAAGIAARTGASLALASVYEPGLPVRGGQGAMVYDQRWDAEMRAALRDGLASTRQRLAAMAPKVRVTSVVLDGAVARTLAAYVTSVGAELIVLTSHGRGGSVGAWLGSVTDELVRRSRIPVLVLRAGGAADSRGPAGNAFRHVLVPLDGSPASEGVMVAAEAVAGTQGVKYTLLRVAPPLHPLLQAVATEDEIERDRAEQREIAEREVRDTDARLRARGFDVSSVVRMDLQPARAIHAVAEEIGADLIAIATHGRGPFGRLLLGSVADKVLRGATVPVLVHRIVEESPAAPLAPQLDRGEPRSQHPD